jgi:hypothetical protein
MNERQNIYLNKEIHEFPPPWTSDKILRTYKFTNVFRQQDRVTRELGKRLNKSDSNVKLFWKVYLFRMFNWPNTYDHFFYEGLVKKWDHRLAIRHLRQMQIDKIKIFTGAYIITNAGSKDPKIDVICKAITPVWKLKSQIVDSIKRANSIERTVNILSEFPNVGKFIGYEIATDLRHTRILKKADDIYTWANPGPGARRGLNRIFREDKKDRVKIEVYISEMKALLEMSENYIDKDIFGPLILEMRDIEHSLCEFDKYMRVVNGEGRPRSLYHARI